MSGPSAIGSENGMPTSIAIAPACSSACIIANEPSRVGKPAVRYGISPVSPARAPNAAVRRDAAKGGFAVLVRTEVRVVTPAPLRVLQRRADVAHLDPEQRVRAR